MALSIVVLSILLALAIVLVARKPQPKTDEAEKNAQENDVQDGETVKETLEKDTI